MGKEPILEGDRVLGCVASANYGSSVGKSNAYGYLPISHAREDTKVEMYHFGNRFKATVSKEPLYDPANSKLKG